MGGGGAGADAGRANLDHLGFGCAAAGAYADAASEHGARADAGRRLGVDLAPTSSAIPASRPFPIPSTPRSSSAKTYKVLRGGAWATRRDVIGTGFRNWDLPQRSQIFSGFRCVREDRVTAPSGPGSDHRRGAPPGGWGVRGHGRGRPRGPLLAVQGAAAEVFLRRARIGAVRADHRARGVLPDPGGAGDPRGPCRRDRRPPRPPRP